MGRCFLVRGLDLRGVGLAISGMVVRRDCLLASRAMRRQRSARLRADWARCFSVRRARIGVIFAMPSSVAFSMAHSMWSNLKTARRRWSGRAASDSSSSWRVKRTSVFGDAGDFGSVEEAVGDDVVDLAGCGAEDSGEVGGLVASEGGGGGSGGVGYEAATGHEY